ncbi:hypothetical protein LZC95_35560 [Pendulispora brunnea]|uniref:Flavodoxin-like domain-containing protein n=1 Tax=Pendulispora brunnea TaxID=2905690 RepID=A0ABZ2JZ51_9BACT
MANILVLYATREGQTKKIATRIAIGMRARGHEVALINAEDEREDLPVTRLDAVCIGAPVHFGRYPRAIARFVRTHRTLLQSTPSSFFSVCMAIAHGTAEGRAEAQKYVDRLSRQTGWTPGHVELFAGAVPYTKYGFFTRWMMQKIARKTGGDADASRDYEYTNWDQVDRFTASVANAAFARTTAAAHQHAAE